MLCSWPEGCRAILLASAGRNIAGGTWWQDVVSRTDASDGAGALDAASGIAIAQSRRWRDAPATRRGWDVGTISSSVIGSDRLATFRYHVQVPALLLLPRVKVALAWDSAVTTASSGDTATASTLTVDLDLLVRDSHGNRSHPRLRGTTATRSPSSRRRPGRLTRSSSDAGRERTASGTASPGRSRDYCGGGRWCRQGCSRQDFLGSRPLSRVSSFDWLGSIAFQPAGFALAGPFAGAIGVSATLLASAAVQAVTECALTSG